MREVKRDLIFSVKLLTKSGADQFFSSWGFCITQNQKHTRTRTHSGPVNSSRQQSLRTEHTNTRSEHPCTQWDSKSRFPAIGQLQTTPYTAQPLVSVLRHVRKISRSYCRLRHVSLCVCMKRMVSHWTDLHETWYLSSFIKSVKKIQVPLKSDKNNGYSASVRMYVYENISLSSFWNEKR
jgi:hypothetical protein